MPAKLPLNWTAQSAALADTAGFRHFRLLGEQGKGAQRSVRLQAVLDADVRLSKSDCENGNPEMPSSVESHYTVEATRPGFVSFGVHVYAYTGGAHGIYGTRCVIADLDKGELFDLGKDLADGARARLTELATAWLKKEQKVTSLTDAGFFEETAKVSDDTALCFTEKDGHAALTAKGGHPGNDAQHAVIPAHTDGRGAQNRRRCEGHQECAAGMLHQNVAPVMKVGSMRPSRRGNAT